MELVGKCKMLRIYMGEDERAGRKRLYDVILARLKEVGVAGVTILRGLEGFGASSRIHSARILEAMEDLPIIMEVVDRPARILKGLNAVEGLLPANCLVTIQDVRVLHYRATGGRHTRSRRL